MEEQSGESGDHVDVEDELGEARDEHRDDQDDDVGTVIVLRRHGAMAVPRANGKAREVHIQVDEQLEDVVARPADGVN